MPTGDATILLETSVGAIALTLDALHRAREAADAIIETSKERNVDAEAKPLIDAHEVARILDVKPSWVLQRARERRLPHICVGKYVRFDAVEILAFLKRMSHQSEASVQI